MSFLKTVLLVTGLVSVTILFYPQSYCQEVTEPKTFNHCQVASMVDVNQCTDGNRSPVDYGDLKQPGSGRILTIKNNQFEVFGEKVFLSGASASVEQRQSMFGDGIYNSKHLHRHECFLWEVSESGGNSVHAHVHGTGNISPLFNASGHVTELDSSGTFITDVRKYLRAAAHYNVVVFFSLWQRELLHHQPAVATDDAVLQSYIDNALLPLVKAIKDEPGFGGIIILENAQLVTYKTKSSEPCFVSKHLNGHKSGLFSIESLIRFAARHVEAIRSIDISIPITIGARSDDLIKNEEPYINTFSDKCFELASGLNSSLSFYAIDGAHSSTSPFTVDASFFNLDKPVIIYHILNVTSLKESYNWAYSHGYSGAWTSAAKRDHLTPTEHLTGIKSLKSEYNPSLGGLVNFTLTKYRICKISGMSDCVDIN